MNRKYSSLVAFDMDGVLTQHASSWQYVHDRIGVSNRKNYELFRSFKISYQEFLESDVKLWMDRLGKVHKDDIISILDEIQIRENLYESMKLLRDNGCAVAIVSGGISWLSDRVNHIFPFDYTYANSLNTDSSGLLIMKGSAYVDPLRKDVVVKELQHIVGLGKKNTVSVGDSIHDVSMFDQSGFSVAFNASDDDVEKRSSVSMKSNNLLELAELILDECLQET